MPVLNARPRWLARDYHRISSQHTEPNLRFLVGYVAEQRRLSNSINLRWLWNRDFPTSTLRRRFRWRGRKKLKGSTEVGVHRSGRCLELTGEHQTQKRGAEQLESL